MAYFKATDKTVLCSTHNLDIAKSNADKVGVLKKGKIKEYENPENIVKDQSYYIAEVDYKYNTQISSTLNESITVKQSHKRYTLFCKNH